MHTSPTHKDGPFFPFVRLWKVSGLPPLADALASVREVGRGAAVAQALASLRGRGAAPAVRAHRPAPRVPGTQRGRSERMHDRLVLHDDWLGRHASTNSVVSRRSPALSTCPSGRLPGPCSPPRRADKTVLKSAIGCAPSVNHGCAPARRGPQAAVHVEQSLW